MLITERNELRKRDERTSDVRKVSLGLKSYPNLIHVNTYPHAQHPFISVCRDVHMPNMDARLPRDSG